MMGINETLKYFSHKFQITTRLDRQGLEIGLLSQIFKEEPVRTHVKFWRWIIYIFQKQPVRTTRQVFEIGYLHFQKTTRRQIFKEEPVRTHVRFRKLIIYINFSKNNPSDRFWRLVIYIFKKQPVCTTRQVLGLVSQIFKKEPVCTNVKFWRLVIYIFKKTNNCVLILKSDITFLLTVFLLFLVISLGQHLYIIKFSRGK